MLQPKNFTSDFILCSVSFQLSICYWMSWCVMNSMFKKTFAKYIIVLLVCFKSKAVIGEIFTLGYLTGSQRRSGNLDYNKPGNHILIFYYFFENRKQLQSFRYLFRYKLSLPLQINNHNCVGQHWIYIWVYWVRHQIFARKSFLWYIKTFSNLTIKIYASINKIIVSLLHNIAL